MNSAPSYPPTALLHPGAARPGLSKCTPEREAEKRETAGWFARWCHQKHLTLDTLGQILGVAPSTARKKFLGESPLNTTDIRKFPRRYRRELTLDFDAYCEANPLDAFDSHG